MALVSIISFSMVDDKGKRKTFPVFTPASGLTVALAGGFVTAFAPLLNAVTEAQILEANVSFPLTLPGGLRSAPIAASDIEEGGLFKANYANSNYHPGYWVPAFLQTAFNGEVINRDDSAVIAFEAGLVSGAGTTPVLPSDDAANDLTAIIAAVKRFRRK